MPGKVTIIGVPMDLGADRRGVDMGPSALRVAGLNSRISSLGYSVEDQGNIPVRVPEMMPFGSKRAKYLPEISDACKELAQAVGNALGRNRTPVVLGGDHSISLGTLAGVSAHFRKRKQKIGLLWIDAHGDMNTPETSPSGNIHGMPLACALGSGPPELVRLGGFAPKVAPENCALIGVRELDPKERKLVRSAGLRAFTMREVDERGLRACMAEALELATRDTAGLAVSLDMDSVDPAHAPGVGTPVRGGFSYREAHLALEMVADTGRLLSLEVVEINPVVDVRNRTAELGVELALSALGKKIL